MPVILDPNDYLAWLDPATDLKKLEPLLSPVQGSTLKIYPVSTQVNDPRFDGPECIRSLQ